VLFALPVLSGFVIVGALQLPAPTFRSPPLSGGIPAHFEIPSPRLESGRDVPPSYVLPPSTMIAVSDATPSAGDHSLRSLAGALTEKTPNVVGGSARIARTRIPIWTLEEYRRLGMADEKILEAYPSLREVDLAAAWAYVALHPDEIEQDIRENDAA
jgi:uncharacterized protein (DUF433 family)